MLSAQPAVTPLDPKERQKRKRETFLIGLLVLLFVGLTLAEFQLTQISKSLPFVNSIFFFGLLNFNIIILIALVWLVTRNVGKLFIERRRKILGARLKTKLVMAFLAFSIIPTLVLFVISAMYINSSFDKWFSLKIQNTLQASLEISGTYYRNTEQTAMHFAEHLSRGIAKKIGNSPSATSQGPGQGAGEAIGERIGQRVWESQKWTQEYLDAQRELLALDAIEFYADPIGERAIAMRSASGDGIQTYPRMTLENLDKAFKGETVSVVQHIGVGDLIRCLSPVKIQSSSGATVVGVVAVNSYIPFSLRNKVDEIVTVFEDYKGTNPLKYPMKTTYSVILIMITMLIIFVAIWIGLYMARELTVPVERLVVAAQEVGAGNLDVAISGSGHDEIAVLVDSFNKMTRDLRDNRERLLQAGVDLENRRLQLEAVLANIGTGVVAIDKEGILTTFNKAVSDILQLEPTAVLTKKYKEVFVGEMAPLSRVIERAFLDLSQTHDESLNSEISQWNFRYGNQHKILAAVATPIRHGEMQTGVVAVIDDLTYLVKGQREMAWREVARRIAHEIKNPLTPIKLSAQRLQRRLSDLRGREAALLKECTETIIQNTDELKEMVNEFSNFARIPEASPAPNDLNEVLCEVISLYQQAHGEILMQIDLEPNLPVFDFDRDQMKRVMINLFDNAIASLTMRLSGSPKWVGKIKVRTHYNEQLQIAVVEIEDNGVGMTDEIKARVFEPYFSTKEEGTGLGLSIVKRIVNDHDGFVRVRSAPNEGAQFFIELPTTRRNKVQPSSLVRFDSVAPLEG